jgi:hypothetical protein
MYGGWAEFLKKLLGPAVSDQDFDSIANLASRGLAAPRPNETPVLTF